MRYTNGCENSASNLFGQVEQIETKWSSYAAVLQGARTSPCPSDSTRRPRQLHFRACPPSHVSYCSSHEYPGFMGLLRLPRDALFAPPSTQNRWNGLARLDLAETFAGCGKE